MMAADDTIEAVQDAPFLPLAEGRARMRWYVVQAQHGKGEIAKQSIIAEGFSAYLPVFNRRRSHARKVDTVTRPLFPGYLFARFEVDEHGWQRIASARGVLRLLCSTSARPLPVPMGVIEDLLARANADGVLELADGIPERRFSDGQRVRITAGPMQGLTGLYLGGEEERVKLLIDMLGRPVRMTIPTNIVDPIGD